ncbi:hypothetical protein J7I93_13720 [Bacillus sp. ISL-47]|uniref:uracil-DNA glycosylase family protein n=1 Tax=Bacillus sp. ISL-47 TaxID=2819130 RepID=UPI001BED3205|nr:uracil-DNA glycosylase family protein [Bacillus sp. ISL-47]MBT2689245.1 hypothetical protein [Bacillus sp. ISL-47]MBT2708630.1 hypothetical protein [Pseudomonas sp. ISL-84]
MIAERVFKCGECKLNNGQQKVFYDTSENKEDLKVMFLFESPGGEIDTEEKLEELNRMTPEQVTLEHRKNFDPWPSNYYLIFRELCKTLHHKGYIGNYPNRLGTDIMKEIYITDAVKCRGDKKEIEDYRNMNGFSCTELCSDTILKQELDRLTNLKLIVSFGNWANKALNTLVEMKGPGRLVKQGPALRTLLYEYDLEYYQQFCRTSIKEHGKVYDFDYKYPNGQTTTIKNIHLYHPSWFYNTNRCLGKANKASIREKLLIESIEWCFSKI